jgi:hypothetical protein
MKANDALHLCKTRLRWPLIRGFGQGFWPLLPVNPLKFVRRDVYYEKLRLLQSTTFIDASLIFFIFPHQQDLIGYAVRIMLKARL